MASPSSSSSRPSPLRRSPLFTPIPELDKEEEELDNSEPQPPKPPEPKPEEKVVDDRQLSVLCNRCRPSSRDKTSVVPVDHNYGTSPLNPKTLLHSLLLTLTRKSPRPASDYPPPAASTSSAVGGPPASSDWRLAAQELSRKLVHATRRRDEALLEASRLKTSVSELERKLDRLESYCLDLKSSLDRAVAGPTPPRSEPLIAAVAYARTSVRTLTRALSVHVRPSRIASLLKTPILNTGTLLVFMEALLNRVFYEGFEKPTSEEAKLLDPKARVEMNLSSYEAVKDLSWEEVLSKGTKHYSEGLSRFCDEKMSEVVVMMGWARAWPESLLQAFFGAAKGIWVVYLLSRSGHPPVTVMRVEKGARFDERYMEDVVVGERKGRGVVTAVTVRMMVAPGFYLCSQGHGVVKSKVLCGYSNTEGSKLKNSD